MLQTPGVVGDNHPFFRNTRVESMRNLSISGFIIGIACVTLAAAPAPEEKDYQKIADKEAWSWDKDKASAVHSQKEYKGRFEVELSKPALEGGFVSTTVRL